MANDDSRAGAGTSETGRLEAFSDGVFAIAVTLLVLDFHAPRANGNRQLLEALGDQWPAYFAYATSFITILIMWLNHHVIFQCVRRADHWLFLFNGLLLFFITFLPYPTSLLGTYLEQPGHTTAAAFYVGTFIAIAVAFNLLWRHAVGRSNLLHPRVNPAFIKTYTRQYNFALPLYLVAFALAFVQVVLSLAVCFGLAVLFALPTKGERPLSAERDRP